MFTTLGLVPFWLGSRFPQKLDIALYDLSRYWVLTDVHIPPRVSVLLAAVFLAIGGSGSRRQAEISWSLDQGLERVLDRSLDPADQRDSSDQGAGAPGAATDGQGRTRHSRSRRPPRYLLSDSRRLRPLRRDERPVRFRQLPVPGSPRAHGLLRRPWQHRKLLSNALESLLVPELRVPR